MKELKAEKAELSKTDKDKEKNSEKIAKIDEEIAKLEPKKKK